MQRYPKKNAQRPRTMRWQKVRLVLLMATIASISPPTVFGLDKIRIGMGAFSPTNSPIWVAEERGFFKKHGIEVEAFLLAAARRAASTRCLPAIFSLLPRAVER